MIIKKFQGKTEEDAVNAAKQELGAGVVIMSVRKVKKKGIAGIFGGQTTEVTVAIEDEAERKDMPTINLSTPPMTKIPEGENVPEPVTIQKEESVSASINSGLERLRALSMAAEKSQKEALEAQARAMEAKAAEEAALKERMEELKAKETQKLLAKSAQLAETGSENIPSASQTVPVMGVDSVSQKTAAGENASVSGDTDGSADAFANLLLETMVDNEIQENYANQILDDVKKNLKAGAPMDSLLSGVYQKMILKFGKQVGISPAQKGPKVLFFVGPTGVGKTTTIAKIASKFSVEEKKKIALLTADTYRIAATEQLRTYANILEVPFRVIYSVEEVDTALNDWKDCEYILVDTAGHSHHNEEQKNNMNDFIHSVDNKNEKEVFLVVSATTKYRDLKNIADVYSGMTDYKLIFTKLDETDTLGNILNLKLYTGASLSYVTCGQNVPDDIENFNPQKTVKQLLGGKN